MKHFKLLLSALAAAVFLGAAFGCGGGKTSGFSSGSASAELTITLDRTECALSVGETVTLEATVSAEGKTVEWSTSEPTVAIVDDGLVTALAAGSATITASVEGKSAACAVTVNGISVKSIDLGVDSPLELVVGGSYGLEPRFLVDGTEETEGVEWSYTPDNVFYFTVDENGVVTADGGQAGMADLFVSAVYEGKTYTETLRIQVKNDVEFTVTPATVRLSAAENGEYPTTAELSYGLVVNGSPVSGGVSWRSENEEIVTVDADGRLTAHKEGSAKVYAENEDGDYAFATVAVSAVEIAGGDYLFKLGDELAFAGDYGAITSVADENGNKLAYTADDSGFKLTGITASGSYTVVVKNGVYNKTITFAVADTIINTLEDFRTWQATAEETKPGNKTYTGYVAFGADIDGNNEEFNGWGAGSYWTGTIDGRGHKISNVRITESTSSLFAEYLASGTIKNLAVTGVSLEGAWTGTLFIRAFQNGESVVENCFVSGKMNGRDIQGLLFCYSDRSNLKVRNCVTVVEDGVVQSGRNAGLFIGFESGKPDVTNTIVIGTEKAVALSATGDRNGSNYTSEFPGVTAVATAEQLDGLDLSGFKGYWNVGGKVPVFEGVSFAPAAKADESIIAEDMTFTLSGMILNTYALKAAAEGISLEGNTVTIAAGTAGTQFTIVATSFTGEVQELAFEVLAPETVSMEALDADLSETTAFTVNLSDKEGEVKSVSIGGAAVEYTIEGGVLSVASSAIGAAPGVSELKILTSANKIYTGELTVATCVISDAEDLRTWQSKHTGEVSGSWTVYNGYVVMAADVDFGGAAYPGEWGANTSWAGTFDGRGHVISNIVFTAGKPLVGDLMNGVVTRLAMTGVTVSGNHTGAISIRAIGTATFSELYISGRQTAENIWQGMIFSYTNVATVKIVRCVVVMEEALPEGVHAAMFITLDTKISITNSVVVGATKAVALNTDGSDYSSNWKATVLRIVNTPEAVKALSIKNYDASVWDVDGDGLIKGKVPTFKGMVVSPAAKASESVITQNCTFTLSAMPLTTFALKEEAAGVTLDGNTVTVAGGAVGAKFTIVATAFNGETQELEFTIVAPEVVDLTATNIDVDLSKGAAFTLDFSDKEGSVLNVSTDYGALGYTFADDTLSIEKAQFASACGVQTLQVVTSANKIYKFTVTVATYIISDAAGLNEWQSKQTETVAGNLTYNGYIVLDADIDFAGAAYAGTWINKTYFIGTFDGRGHTISNIIFNGRALVGDFLGGTVKNLALKNVTVQGSVAAICIRPITNGLVENVFVSGKCTSDLSGLICAYSSNSAWAKAFTIRNCVVVAEQEFTGRQGGFVVAYSSPGALECTPNLENCVLIGSAVGVGVWDASTNGAGAHITADTSISVYADDAAWTAGAPSSVTGLGPAWSYDAATKTLKLLGNAVYTAKE